LATAAITADFINTRGRVEAYDTLSIASRALLSVHDRLHRGLRVLNLAGTLWNLDRHLSKFLQSVYSAMESADEVRSQSEKNTEVATRERAEKAVSTLRSMHEIVDNVYQRSRHARLTNHSLLSVSLNSIHARNEEIADLMEWLEIAFDQEFLKTHAYENARALEEFERGETFDLAQVK